jgi:hypothetical protein
MRSFHVQHIPGPHFMRSVSPRMIRSEQHPYRLYAYHTRHCYLSCQRASKRNDGWSQSKHAYPCLNAWGNAIRVGVTFNSVSLSELEAEHVGLQSSSTSR